MRMRAKAGRGGAGKNIMTKKQYLRIGGISDDFLREERIFEEVQTQAIRGMIASQLEKLR